MAYSVKILKRATNDLDEILNNMATQYPGTASRFINDLERVLANIAENPKLYQVYSSNPQYHRAIISDYLLFYRIFEESKNVRVYRVLHGKRDIKTLL